MIINAVHCEVKAFNWHSDLAQINMENYHIIGGENHQTFLQEGVGPKVSPKPLWSKKNFECRSAPFVKDKVLYVCQDGLFYAIDADNGDVLWTFEMPGQASPPVILENKLILGGHYIDSHLYVLDKDTGNLSWKFRTGTSNAPIHKSPIIVDDLIIFPAGKTLYALNIHTQKPHWKFKLGKKVGSFPATYGAGMVFMITNEGLDKQHIYCVEVATGNESWRMKAPGLSSHLVFTQNALFYTDRDNHLNIIDPVSGTANRFKVFEGSTTSTSYLAAAGSLLLIVFGNKMAALHLETMEWAWTFSSKGAIGQPTIADGIVYFATCFDGIYGLELVSGKTLFRINTAVRSVYPCAIENETLYMAGSMNEHEILAYRVKVPRRKNPIISFLLDD